MRVVLIALALLAAGCLEPGTDEPSATPSVTPSPSPPPAASPTLTPSPSPTPTPTPGPTPTPTGSPSPPPNGSVVAFRSLGAGSWAGVHEAERVVIADQAAYEAFWARVREDPAQGAPAVDLSASTVVGVVLGARPDTCWAVRVTNATSDGAGGVLVEVTTYGPPPNAMCGQAITYPWHLVALDGADRDVAFVERTRAGPLPGE